jgi:hypothetical protein
VVPACQTKPNPRIGSCLLTVAVVEMQALDSCCCCLACWRRPAHARVH